MDSKWIGKNENSKNQIPACEQKTTIKRAATCSNTVFSFYFEVRGKKIHAAKAFAFPLNLLFQHDQNHFTNINLNNMKKCEQILIGNTAGRPQ